MTVMGIVLIILFVFLLVFLFARFLSGPVRRTSLRFKAFFVGGYAVLVTLLAVVSLFLPANALNKGNTTESPKASRNNTVELCSKIRKGDFSPTADLLSAKKYSFSTRSNKLYIRDETFPVLVGIKGVDTPDNGSETIDVYVYLPRNSAVSYCDTSFHLEHLPPAVSLSGGNTLSLDWRQKRVTDFYSFNDSAAAGQFFTQNRVIMSFFSPQRIVVLVPKYMEISGDYDSLSS